VQAVDLKRQMPTFYSQIQRAEAIALAFYVSRRPVKNEMLASERGRCEQKFWRVIYPSRLMHSNSTARYMFCCYFLFNDFCQNKKIYLTVLRQIFSVDGRIMAVDNVKLVFRSSRDVNSSCFYPHFFTQNV